MNGKTYEGNTTINEFIHNTGYARSYHFEQASYITIDIKTTWTNFQAAREAKERETKEKREVQAAKAAA